MQAWTNMHDTLRRFSLVRTNNIFNNKIFVEITRALQEVVVLKIFIKYHCLLYDNFTSEK